MNTLNGEVKEILSEGEIVIVKIDVKGQIFNVLMLDANSLQNLKIGISIQMLFKEHELSFASLNSLVSIENSFPAKITQIKKGKLLHQVFFDFHGQELSSIITQQKSLELGLCENSNWLCFVRANDIILKANND